MSEYKCSACEDTGRHKHPSHLSFIWCRGCERGQQVRDRIAASHTRAWTPLSQRGKQTAVCVLSHDLDLPIDLMVARVTPPFELPPFMHVQATGREFEIMCDVDRVDDGWKVIQEHCADHVAVAKALTASLLALLRETIAKDTTMARVVGPSAYSSGEDTHDPAVVAAGYWRRLLEARQALASQQSFVQEMERAAIGSLRPLTVEERKRVLEAAGVSEGENGALL